MPPKKDPSQTKKPENKKEENKDKEDKKKKAKDRRKATGMGGTIGLFPKKVKTCPSPCVKSFTQPSACCPQEMPICCSPAPPPCFQMVCLRSPAPPPPCCPNPNYY